jgi:type IV pilus assembly protein PilE
MRRGFSLIELLVVLIIIGILATISISYYGATVEKSRTSEAKAMLTQIRTSWWNYRLDRQADAATFTDIGLEESFRDCKPDRYFQYNILANTHAVAVRCGSGGKAPNRPQDTYTIKMNISDGSLSSEPPGRI